MSFANKMQRCVVLFFAVHLWFLHPSVFPKVGGVGLPPWAYTKGFQGVLYSAKGSTVFPTNNIGDLFSQTFWVRKFSKHHRTLSLFLMILKKQRRGFIIWPPDRPTEPLNYLAEPRRSAERALGVATIHITTTGEPESLKGARNGHGRSTVGKLQVQKINIFMFCWTCNLPLPERSVVRAFQIPRLTPHYKVWPGNPIETNTQMIEGLLMSAPTA